MLLNFTEVYWQKNTQNAYIMVKSTSYNDKTVAL